MKTGMRDVLHIEETMPIPRIHDRCFGTPDVWFFNSATETLHILDFKFGHGHVDEYMNQQMIAYAAGALDLLGIDGFHEQTTNVVMTIVQPRNYHRDGPIRRHVTRAVELRGWINILRAKAEEACGPRPRFAVNENCQHCSGRHACEAYQHAALNAVVHSKATMPLDLPPAALGLELTILKRAKQALDGRISGLEESVFAAIQSGQRVPGWGEERPDGRVVFNRPVEEVIMLGELYGKDLSKRGTVTPKQAIKMGIPEEVIETVSTSNKGAPKLVPDNLNNIRKVFSK